MKILAACEESQAVTIAFRSLGHDAFSCDLQECSGGHPEWHIKDDAIKVMESDNWDLVIAFPPCTYLTKAGAQLLRIKGKINYDRYNKGLAAREFFMKFYNSDIDHICIENPVPLSIYNLPKYSQIIQPYYFGHPYTKTTCLWLKGLPHLFASELVIPEKSWVFTNSNPKMRSKTFTGVANAMAIQWSNFLTD